MRSRVSLRTVVGGMVFLWFGFFMKWAAENELRLWIVAGLILVLFLSAAGLAMMFRKTRHDRSERRLLRWFLETLHLTGTLAVVVVVLISMLRGYSLLAR